MEFAHMNVITDLISKLECVSDISSFKIILENIANKFEFDHFILGYIHLTSSRQYQLTVLDNFSQSWSNSYLENDLISIDPIVKTSYFTYEPIVWSRKKNQVSLTSSITNKHCQSFTKNQKKFVDQLYGFDVRGGVSIPMHMPSGRLGILSLANHQSRKEKQHELQFKNIHNLNLILPSVFAAYDRISSEQSATPTTTLTNREIECLSWAAEGKSAWEISMIVGCSERTVTYHLANASSKLGATNRYQAISKAIYSGLLSSAIS